MNKAKLKKLAREQAGQGGEPTPEAAPKAPETPETDRRPPATPNHPDDVEALQAQIYAALVGGSDFVRTQAGPAEVCRIALRRSEIAVDVWLKAKSKGGKS